MTTFRQFNFLDIFNFNAPTLDSFIFAYPVDRYANHCMEYQPYNAVVEHPNGEIMAYVVGKSDGDNEQDLHGHITSLTVSPKYRRLGIATKLLKFVEDGSERNNMKYVDLFVRRENETAISLYKSCGYKFHRIHRRMYQRTHDAFEYRKYFKSNSRRG